MLITVRLNRDNFDTVSAVFIKPLKEGFLLVYCQDRLSVIDHTLVIVDSMDVIEFIQNYI